MKKLRIPHRQRPRSFQEKFSADAEFFGNREGKITQKNIYLPRVLLGLFCGTLLWGGVLFLGSLWTVSDVTAAEGTLYTSAVVEEYAGIRAGDAMLGFDSSTVVRRLKAGLPMLDHIKVRKHLNGEVTISFEEITEVYYTCHNANYYVISAEDREVLGVFSESREAKRVGAVYLGLPENARVRVGERLSFINLPYEPDSIPDNLVDYEVETDEPDEEYAYVFEFVKALSESSLGSRVTGMELGDRYDIWFVLDRRIKVKIGSMDELDRKLSMTERSLNDRTEQGKDDGSMPVLVDVSVPSRIIHRASPDIELPDWAKELA